MNNSGETPGGDKISFLKNKKNALLINKFLTSKFTSRIRWILYFLSSNANIHYYWLFSPTTHLRFVRHRNLSHDWTMWCINHNLVHWWQVLHHPRRRLFCQGKIDFDSNFLLMICYRFTWMFFVFLYIYITDPITIRRVSFPYILSTASFRHLLDSLISIHSESYGLKTMIETSTSVSPMNISSEVNPNYYIKLHESQSHRNHHHQRWSL